MSKCMHAICPAFINEQFLTNDVEPSGYHYIPRSFAISFWKLNFFFFYRKIRTFINMDYQGWLEENIQSENINYFDRNEFTEYEVIGMGGFGVVESAEWKNRGIKVALKSL